MREVEAMLREGRGDLHRLAVPEELEARLRAALGRKGRRGKLYLPAAVVAVFLLFFLAYNFNAIAYYARQILGFEQIMTGTLKDLNELGKGQIIGKSCTLDGGIRFTLEGIMVDGNRLIAFITQENPSADPFEVVPHFAIRGLLGSRYGSGSGHGQFSEDRSTVRYIFDFEPPGLLERHLTLSLSCLVDGVFQERAIDFCLDRSKAMGFSLREEIRRSMELEGGGRIDFNTIAVSPSMTALEGALFLPQGDPLLEGVFPQFGGLHLELKLFADGWEVESLGGHLGGGTPGEYTFRMLFDTLPPDCAAIEIELAALTERQRIGRHLELAPGELGIPLVLEGNTVTLKELEITPERALLTLSTESKNPLIEEAHLCIGETRAALIGIEDGPIQESGGERLTAEWRLVFEALPRSDRYVLEIETICYPRNYAQSFTVTVAK